MSSDTLASLVPYLLVLAALGLFGVVYWKDHQRRDRAWREFAASRDWDITASWNRWSIDGLHGRKRFQIRTEYIRRGSYTRGREYPYAVVSLELGEALPAMTRIRPEKLGRKVLKVFGKSDEEVGDAELDNAFELENLSDEVRAVLRTPDVRRQLLVLRSRFDSFSIEDTQLTARHRGLPNSVATLEALVTPALQLSDALDQAVEGRRERRPG